MKAKSLISLAAAIDAHLHQFAEIPLNTESSDYGYCGGDKVCGPTLYVSGRKDSKVFDIPKDGEAKIKYRLRSKSVSYRDDGTERYSTDIEVQSIEPTNLEAVLEKYNFGDRARDAGGRYSPGQDVSVDDMADAYVKPASTTKKALLVGAAGASIAAVAGRRKVGAVMGRGVGRLVRGALG